jgi:hypothetical protein
MHSIIYLGPMSCHDIKLGLNRYFGLLPGSVGLVPNKRNAPRLMFWLQDLPLTQSELAHHDRKIIKASCGVAIEINNTQLHNRLQKRG